MKKYSKILLIAVCVFLLAGCDFLNVEKLGQNDIPKTFSNMDGLRTAKVGMYRELYDFYDGSGYMKYAEIAADMVDLTPTATDMLVQYNYVSRPEDVTTVVEYIWRDGYSVLANANNILYYAPGLRDAFPNSAKEIDLIRAQALFVRALAHFMLCNTYAQPYNYTSDASHPGVPALTRLAGSSDLVGRNTVAEVYKRITDDLQEACTLFGSNNVNSPYEITYRACKALQARIYLYMGNMESAAECASEVMKSMALTPRDKYESMMHADIAGDETIFRIDGLNISSHALRTFYATDGPAIASSKLRNTFYDAGDIRWQMVSGRTIRKYHNAKEDITGTTKPAEKDIPYAPFILRLSEMYLIRAEAYCGLNQLDAAAADLKAIIARAMGKTVAEVGLSYTNAADLMNIIERERILELTGEGHRFFDLIRWKRGVERSPDTNSYVKTMTYPNNKFILPITRTEMDGNKGMTQNPM